MSIVSRNVKNPSPRVSVALTRTLIIAAIIVVVGLLTGTWLRHNADRHEKYLQQIAASYHYTPGKSYYCYLDIGTYDIDKKWVSCKVIGVENNFQEYFVEAKDATDNTFESHIHPENMAHDGKYYGHTL